VDDDVDVIDILTTILKKEGYEIVAANDKVDALKKAFAEKTRSCNLRRDDDNPLRRV